MTKSKVRSTDVLLVTATGVETRAVLNEFGAASPPRASSVGDRVYFDLGSVGDADVTLTQCEMGSGGIGASQQAVAKGIVALAPGCVIMVGIAFGTSAKKQRLGSIVVAKQLFPYELQRVGTSVGGAARIVPRGDRPHSSPRLLNLFKSATTTWIDPEVAFGLVLTGEKLIDSEDYRDQLAALSPEAIGGEMEGAGLYVACHDQHVDWLLVKAICDFADGRKSVNKEKRQSTAASNAARFVRHALEFAPWKSSELERDNALPRVRGSHVSAARGRRASANVAPAPLSSCAEYLDSAELARLERYLGRVLGTASRLPLGGVDPKSAGQAVCFLELREFYTPLRAEEVSATWSYRASVQEHQRATSKSIRTEARRRPRARDRSQSAIKLQTDWQLDADEIEVLRSDSNVSALRVLSAEPRLVLLGDPGSGKSMFTSFVAACLAGEALGHRGANLARLCAEQEIMPWDPCEVSPWKHGAILPLRVTLRDLAARGLPYASADIGAATLWDFLAKEDIGEFVPLLKRVFEQSGGLILFDGLDEVPDADQRREQIKRVVQRIASDYPRCRIAVTCRTYAYESQHWVLNGFGCFRLLPFSGMQIASFVARWYSQARILRGLSVEDAAGRSAALRHAIRRSERLRELARWPLLLTLMASLHAWRGGTLPERRQELYSDAVDLLLDWWEGAKVVRGVDGNAVIQQPSLSEWIQADRRSIRMCLNRTAFEVHGSQLTLDGTADIPEGKLVGDLLAISKNPDTRAKRLVEYISDRAGLLVSRGNGVYAFPHRTFQEYLAACYLTEHRYPYELAKLVSAEPDRWREVTLLAAAKVAAGAPASLWLLIDRLCSDSDGDADARQLECFMLAGQALAESPAREELVREEPRKTERVRDSLVQAMSSNELKATDRARSGDALGEVGDPRMIASRMFLPADALLGFLEVPAGPFGMGSKAGGGSDNDERPFHVVELEAYYVARWPVTVAQYHAFEVSVGGCIDSPISLGKLNHPIVGVGVERAWAYVEWLNCWLLSPANPSRLITELLVDGWRVSLPSEAEWEKAARGLDGRVFPWGDNLEVGRANYGETGVGSTTAVGTFVSGASPYGCEDMSGNVWELTRSLWMRRGAQGAGVFRYPYCETDGREVLAHSAPSGTRWVARGGSYRSSEKHIRAAFRHAYWATEDPVGFRLALVRSRNASG